MLAEKSAIRDIARIVADTPLTTLKAWETFNTIDQASPYLSRRFVAAQFAFRNHELLGESAIIGHEISHGFDDLGRNFDASGALRDWWALKDAAHYRIEAEKVARQVDAYEILPGVHLNGRQTLGENIADLAGVVVALDAYHASLHGRAAPVIDGLTGDQRFFIAWAQKWRRKDRDDVLRAKAAAEQHSPARFRAIGAVRNVDAWYSAFNVKPGDR